MVVTPDVDPLRQHIGEDLFKWNQHSVQRPPFSTCHMLKTCIICGIVLCDKHAHFQGDFWCDEHKAHLCTNHAVHSASWYATPVRDHFGSITWVWMYMSVSVIIWSHNYRCSTQRWQWGWRGRSSPSPAGFSCVEDGTNQVWTLNTNDGQHTGRPLGILNTHGTIKRLD